MIFAVFLSLKKPCASIKHSSQIVDSISSKCLRIVFRYFVNFISSFEIVFCSRFSSGPSWTLLIFRQTLVQCVSRKISQDAECARGDTGWSCYSGQIG